MLASFAAMVAPPLSTLVRGALVLQHRRVPFFISVCSPSSSLDLCSTWSVSDCATLPRDLTGHFCTSRRERESTRRTAGYGNEEVQGRTDRDVAEADRSGHCERKAHPASL